jgi:transcriptional regulator with XRE-family HTH domain
MKTRIWPYPDSKNALEIRLPHKRPSHIPADGESFSKRLARLRKAAGYSQYTLADAVGITNRMVAYYEGETDHPPTHLLPKLAQVLGVTTDQLLGIQKVKEVKQKDSRLWQRFAQVEKLPPRQRKKIVDILDAFLRPEKPQA